MRFYFLGLTFGKHFSTSLPFFLFSIYSENLISITKRTLLKIEKNLECQLKLEDIFSGKDRKSGFDGFLGSIAFSMVSWNKGQKLSAGVVLIAIGVRIML